MYLVGGVYLVGGGGARSSPQPLQCALALWVTAAIHPSPQHEAISLRPSAHQPISPSAHQHEAISLWPPATRSARSPHVTHVTRAALALHR